MGDLSSPIKIDKVIKFPMTRPAEFIEAKADKIKCNFSNVIGKALGMAECSKHIDHHAVLMEEVKSRIKLSSKREPMKLLTLVPGSWSRERVSSEVEVSERQVKESRKLKKENGILFNSTRSNKGNKAISEEVKAAVKERRVCKTYARGKTGCIASP